MQGLSEREVMLLRQKTLKKLRKRCGRDIELINNYYHKDAPKNAGRLWHLGTSIRQMEEADAIYFDSRWMRAKNCRVEYMIAKIYKLKIIDLRLNYLD